MLLVGKGILDTLKNTFKIFFLGSFWVVLISLALLAFAKHVMLGVQAQAVYFQRVDVGSTTNFTDTAGNVWSADQAYTAGSWGYYGANPPTYATTAAIANTTDDPLYRNTRRNSSLWGYRFDVPNGTYTVTLKFAEIYSPSFRAGARIGNYALEGTVVLPNFDIYVAAGNAGNTAVDRTFTVNVTDGQLNIDVTPVASGPAINAIEVLSADGSLPTPTPTPVVTPTPTPSPTPSPTPTPIPSPTPTPPPGAYTQRVDTGSNTNFTDSAGNVWSADRTFSTGSWGYVGGNAYTGNQSAIANTNDDVLYRTTHYNNSFEYRFTVPNGTYRVTLKLAEVRSASCVTGARVFNVYAEGSSVISNHDSFAQAGCATVADRTFTSIVSDGVLNLNFTQVAGYPSVNGIEVVTAAPDFTFTASPASQIMGVNDTIQYEADLTFVAGFNSNSTQLWVSGLPSGVTGVYNFNPVPHEGTYLLNLTSNNTVTPGTYTFTMGATADSGLSHSQNVTLVISDQPDYRMSATPIAQSVTAGASGNYDILFSSVNSFASQVTLSASGLPSGATAVFNPNPVAPNASSLLTISTQPTTSSGNYTITVSGSGGGINHAVPITLTVSGGRIWNISSVGSTGDQNNSVIMGDGHNDGVTRIYVGEVSTGQISEFTWSGLGWSAPVVIGTSTDPVGNRNIHNMGFGRGRNDTVNRVYPCSSGGSLYELSYDNATSTWTQATVGVPHGECTHAAVGDGRNDGRNRLYASRATGLYEYTWNGTGWDEVAIGDVTVGIAHGVFIGPGRNDNLNNIYVASSASGTYEARFVGGVWTMASMGDTEDIVNVYVGNGRNDATPVNRVYSSVRTAGQVREFSWNGSGWTTTLTSAVGEWLIHQDVVDGRGDGVRRIYSSGNNGNVFEFTWSGSGWTTNTLTGGSGYMYGFYAGNGRNDGKTRLYGASFNTQVYEYSF